MAAIEVKAFAGLAAAIVFGVGYGFRALVRKVSKDRQRRQMRRRVAQISDIREGQRVTLVGTLHGTGLEELLVAPLTGRICLGYELEIWRQRVRGTKEDCVVDEAVLQPQLWLRPGEGRRQRVLIDLRQTELDLLTDQRAHSLDHEGLAALIDERNISATYRGRKRLIRGHEAVLREGDRVAVSGQVVLRPDPAPEGEAACDYRSTPMCKCLTAPEGKHLVVSNARIWTKAS
jgi:hypothetical protein